MPESPAAAPSSDSCVSAVPGVRVSHWTDRAAATGCTVLLVEDGAVAAVAVRGPYPASRDVAFLTATASPVEVHAVLLCGGSIFGLDAATGVTRYLEENGRGARVGPFITPRVPAAGIFDRGLGRADVRPTAVAGYAACRAVTDGPVPRGTVGVGTGATVGKLLGARRAMKGGFGSAVVTLGDGVVVGAAVVTNPLGSVHDLETGAVVAGPRRDGEIADGLFVTLEDDYRSPRWMTGSSTTLAVVVTNAPLTRVEAARLAEQAHDGLALAIRPVHTEFDGDTVFCLSTRAVAARPDPLRLGSAAVVATARAVLDSVRRAEGIHEIPSALELGDGGGEER